MSERIPLCVTDGCYETKTNRGWGSGPWDGEPDRTDFRASGFPAFVHRNRLGAWCGYVGVPRKHPAFGHDCNEVPVSVHGRLTFASKCYHGHHLCHVGGVVWWLGFDLAHAGDYSPGVEANVGRIRPADWPFSPTVVVGRPVDWARAREERYWTMAEAVAETQHLAHQLAALSGRAISLARAEHRSWRGDKARNPRRRFDRATRALPKAVAVARAARDEP